MSFTHQSHKITLSTAWQYKFVLAGYFDSKQKVPFAFLTKDMTKRQI
ncbi:hypothetical protein PJIAN_34 [Paludibacter jiangxiensis]|uniref:Uncharacterized protein n=1 Tax=Paludibacter jiangxiensis TaxID=681398 RepID=A0A170ZIH5_9BACT|nr:hypothetical protein PJIAN_34 [Paludibacter jiangxiensis]